MLIVPSEIMNEYVSDEKNEILEHPENVNLKMFKKCPFVAVQRDLKVGSIFHKYCAEDKMIPNVIMESKNIDIVLSLCMEGLGALVCPDIFLSLVHIEMCIRDSLRGAGDNMGWLGYNRVMETNVRRTSEN